MTPAARREAVSHLRESFSVSERRACRTLASDRSSMRYRSRRSEPEALLQQIRQLAEQFPRDGYRRQTRRLLDLGHVVNAKRVLRLRRLLGIEARWEPRPSGSLSGPAKPVRWATLPVRRQERIRRVSGARGGGSK